VTSDTCLYNPLYKPVAIAVECGRGVLSRGLSVGVNVQGKRTFFVNSFWSVKK